ncbi:MAG: hypothetical protein P8J87_06455 [Verrucomicrobiales bacterium]|nr:hypothetical protein [Verrucomicrobiales bacterium]
MKSILATLILTISIACPSTRAQEKPPADHPAAKVVAQFLPSALNRDWTKASNYVEPSSLAKLQRDWIAETKRAATIDQENTLIRSIGKQNLDEIAKMPASEFYAAYQISLQRRYNVDPERLKVIADSLELTFLSIALETDRLCHVLVRTRHQDGTNNVSRLELISAVNTSGKWKVSLDEQRPVVTPIKK